MFEFCICLCGVAACTFHRERFLHRKRHTFCVKSSQSLVRDGEEGFGRSLEGVSDKQDQLPSSPGVSTLFTGRRAQAAPKTRTGRAKSLSLQAVANNCSCTYHELTLTLQRSRKTPISETTTPTRKWLTKTLCVLFNAVYT